ncbi:LytR/AlgR family response regulator transcription factor [Cellulosimicrobium marinum]|uniref:LytR/AlgR family response regulator transcription factor n=1 Tax=Cellulosimicrobium marinum TaxID=1638992 RepID=UPI001E5039F6|nr:LytTR family DNA-binding domain-containing protein [Cellulosimicrobium marinum]MCB7135877.1 LytTR family DNA-binding domain-containing protein [Cellulosimicrobium marinum]
MTAPDPGPAPDDARAVLDVLVADDEQPVLDDLVRLLRADPHVRSVRTASSGSEALRVLAADPLDAAFLDIHMPGLSGLDLARALSRFSPRPAVVLVTADEARALEAFDLEVVDYVLKPVRSARLARAVERVVERGAERGVGRGVERAATTGPPHTDPAPPRREAPPDDETLVVTVGQTTRVVRRSAVRWVQAQGDYSRLVTDTDSSLVREPLTDLEERWSAAGFLRVHRSYLVQRDAVTAARFSGSRPVLVVAGQEIPVSRRMLPVVRDAILRPHRRPS